MSDIATTPDQALAELADIDLTSVDISRPIIKDGTILSGTIKKIEAKQNSKQTGYNLNLAIALDNSTKAEDGRDLNVGFELYDLVSLVKTDKYNPLEKLAAIQVAVYGEQRKGFKTEDYLGKPVTFKVGVEDDTGFGRKNRITRFFKKVAAASL